MLNTPEIATSRLKLRKFTLEDVEAFYLVMRDKEVNTFLPLFPLKNRDEAKQHLDKNYLKTYENTMGFRYALCLRHDNIPIGYVNVAEDDSHDLGYGLRKEYWNQGFITEACNAVIQKLKATSIPYITATHDINNPASGRVMKKIGMTYRYSYREQWQPKNLPVIFRMYQLNLVRRDEPTYMHYWNINPVHYIEENIQHCPRQA